MIEFTVHVGEKAIIQVVQQMLFTIHSQVYSEQLKKERGKKTSDCEDIHRCQQ